MLLRGFGGLYVGARRSLCRALDLFVSGPGAPCVGACCSLCRDPVFSVESRRRGPEALSQDSLCHVPDSSSSVLCIGAQHSGSGPGAFCVGSQAFVCVGSPALCPSPALLLRVGPQRSLCRGAALCLSGSGALYHNIFRSRIVSVSELSAFQRALCRGPALSGDFSGLLRPGALQRRGGSGWSRNLTEYFSFASQSPSACRHPAHLFTSEPRCRIANPDHPRRPSNPANHKPRPYAIRLGPHAQEPSRRPQLCDNPRREPYSDRPSPIIKAPNPNPHAAHPTLKPPAPIGTHPPGLTGPNLPSAYAPSDIPYPAPRTPSSHPQTNHRTQPIPFSQETTPILIFRRANRINSFFNPNRNQIISLKNSKFFRNISYIYIYRNFNFI